MSTTEQTKMTSANQDYLHNVLHEQAACMVNNPNLVNSNSDIDEYWISAYVGTDPRDRVRLGYPLSGGSW